MAFDEGLAQRLRETLAERQGIEEKQMFGGLSFLLQGNMCVGVIDDEMVVRVGPDNDLASLAKPHTRPFGFTGRPMKGWVMVAQDGLDTDDALADWVESGVAFASSLPPKSPLKSPSDSFTSRPRPARMARDCFCRERDQLSDLIQIENIGQHVGQTVTLRGWLYGRTDKGKLQFLLLRDGSGTAQCVIFQKNVSEDTFEAAASLTQESSFVVTGEVRADERAPGMPGGYELDVQAIEVLQVAEPYPITPKEHGPDFLLDQRHLWLRSSRQWAILRVRATVVKAIRDWLDNHDYLNIDTPIISGAAGENTTTLFEVDYFGDPAYLAQTGQLYSEATIGAFGKVYCFGPTFRAEKSKTRRHLTEFWMVEPEMAFFSLEDLMDMQEEFVSYVVQTALTERRAELESLKRDLSRLENIKAPFERISYDDAVELLTRLRDESDDPEQKELLTMEWGNDFGSPHETAIANHFDRPVFVYHYPTAAKSFYMTPVDGRPEVCRSVDLLAPEGYGEITGGSERIHDLALIEERVKEMGLPLDAYSWYVDLRRFGAVPHAGFGLGVERTVAWICGTQHIRETIPFPRMLKRAYP